MGHPRKNGHDKRLILRLRDSPPLGRRKHTSRLIEQSLRKHFAAVHEFRYWHLADMRLCTAHVCF